MEKLPLLFQERRSQIKVGKTTWDWHTGYGDPAARAGGPSTSLSDLRNSVKKIRAQADRQRLLSPKSAMALAKLETGKAKLTESDVNALEYLLGRLQDNSGTAGHAALLADHLRRKP
ncbi:hypothetical protein LZK82_09670 [Rhizobium leguminosarum]|nr:hypothetical protein LZK82_09670 [Rhizobium leguminosarum]UIK12496.1 hypothetical protein LZK80_09735 [Rhizobium leguminosarum]UIL29491.1 hypothetical protein LZK75_09755 [Rhizobium leguminosarum]